MGRTLQSIPVTQDFNAHINIEICSTVSAVKYLYKYVYKVKAELS